MKFFWFFAVIFSFEFCYVVGQTEYFDVSCHPGYKQNQKAIDRLNSRINSTCSHYKQETAKEAFGCYKDCLIQLTMLIDYMEDLNQQDHESYLAQYFPMDTAKTIAGDVFSKCNDVYKKAMAGEGDEEQEQTRCAGDDDVKWNAVFDCVENVWKCKG